MQICITDLQAYNEGHLVGKWIKLPVTAFELSQAISEVLCEGEVASGSDNHEELFISDYEADIYINEYDDLEEINELAKTLESFSDDDWLKFKLLSYEGYNDREVIRTGIVNYDVDIYDYRNNTSFTDTFELLAQDFIDEGLFGEIPKSLEYYIDYSAIARDLRMEYTEFEPNVIGRIQ